jgi:hypothetical protein
MSGESTKIHGPADSAPSVSNIIAHCKVCGVEWAVSGDFNNNVRGCAFCDAPAEALSYTQEERTGLGLIA